MSTPSRLSPSRMSATKKSLQAQTSVAQNTELNETILWLGFFGVVVYFLWIWAEQGSKLFTTNNIATALLMSFVALLVWNTSIVSMFFHKFTQKNVVVTHMLHLAVFFAGALAVLHMRDQYRKDEEKKKQ